MKIKLNTMIKKNSIVTHRKTEDEGFKRVAFTFLLAFVLFSCSKVANKTSPPQDPNLEGVDEVFSHFKNPPPDYSLTFYWGWDGKITEEVIARDLDAFKERGVNIVTLEPGYDMGSSYLSPEWLDMVKRTVQLAKERDMRVWIVDEGKYPSGFAGGKFSTEAPELRMKALVVADRIDVEGESSFSKKLENDIVSAIAINKADSTNQVINIREGELNWTAPAGQWEVVLIKHDFRSSPTRAVNNPTRGKDDSNSLLDYLDPAATLKYLEFTHEEHKKRIGSEFGTTVLGFRGDEPDYSIRGIPWTTNIFSEFEKRKGYDIKPFTASFFAPKLTEEQIRIKADYYDVWSDMFGEHFFKQQADWCAANNVDYLVHLNKEDNMMALVEHEGDFFECMRHVQMPGIDAIWNQIWPEEGKVADFPKYASSVSHVYGKPRSFTESFAAYHTKPNVEQAKWVLDHQLVRGINMIEVMFIPASTNGELGLRGWTGAEKFPQVARYLHRASYLLSQGRPAAKIAVYHPTTSLWMENKASNDFTLKLMQNMLETQHDFDFIDETALSTEMELGDGTFTNLSGQVYSTVIIPSALVVSRKAIKRLEAFASSGGKVVILGEKPSYVVDKSFRDATAPEDMHWALYEPTGELTKAVLMAFPNPDVQLDKASPSIKYIHRTLADGELYFFFNESEEPQKVNVKLEGSGQVQEWIAMSGEIKDIEVISSKEGSTLLELNLQKYETKFIVVR